MTIKNRTSSEWLFVSVCYLLFHIRECTLCQKESEIWIMKARVFWGRQGFVDLTITQCHHMNGYTDHFFVSQLQTLSHRSHLWNRDFIKRDFNLTLPQTNLIYFFKGKRLIFEFFDFVFMSASLIHVNGSVLDWTIFLRQQRSFSPDSFLLSIWKFFTFTNFKL